MCWSRSWERGWVYNWRSIKLLPVVWCVTWKLESSFGSNVFSYFILLLLLRYYYYFYYHLLYYINCIILNYTVLYYIIIYYLYRFYIFASVIKQSLHILIRTNAGVIRGGWLMSLGFRSVSLTWTGIWPTSTLTCVSEKH